MISNFKSFIREKQLFQETDKVLLAVSGGMDSMAMAELFHECGYDFALVHCNFKLRGKDSDEDERFVEMAAGRFGVTLYSRSFNTREIAEDTGDSVQMVARDTRYDYFEEVAEKHGFDFIATAHHLDDQTETFFINLLRGCGIAGLHGISEKQGKIIRPMMFAFRKDIEEFIKSNDIPFREDRSNQSLKYMRNKIRHELIPLFREMNPAFEKEMARNINRLSETEEIFKKYISLKKEELFENDGETVSINIGKLKSLEAIHTYLFELISGFGFKKDDVGNIITAIDGIPGKKFLSPSHQLIIDREKIIISVLSISNKSGEEYFVAREDSMLTRPLELSISTYNIKGYSIPAEKQIASFDLQKLRFPLHLRHWKEGDAFVPLGMKNRKKLSDFFIDEKFSLLQKERTWILCSGKDIIWIVGERIDDRYKISGETREVYRIEME